MKTIPQCVCLLLAAVFLWGAGCGGKPEPQVAATPENASEARNQMRAIRSQIKSSGAPYLQEMLRRGEGLEKSGGEAMDGKDYTKAHAAFAEARKIYQQAAAIEAGMASQREAALAAQKNAEEARAAANAATKAEARPESFAAASNMVKDAEDALAKEDVAKAKELYDRAAASYQAAKAEGEKLMRAELSNAALAAKKEVETARAAAAAASKPDARPESFTAAATAEKEAEEAMAKEDFAKAKEFFARAAESYKTAQADGQKLLRDEMSRDAYARKKEAETERLAAEAASKPDARPASFVAAGNSFKEGEEALTKEDFAKAKELFARAAEGFKTSVGDVDKSVRADVARAAWTKELAGADTALLGRQAAAEFAKLKSQTESAVAQVAANPGQAADQLSAATKALKELLDQSKTKENMPKAAPILPRMEAALRAGDWLLSHRSLGELEQLIPADPRMADFRAKAEALAWPKELAVDFGGGTIVNFVHIKPGKFTMGEQSEKHEVTLTKPFFIGKYEVTQQQWQAVMGSNPSYTKIPQHPVEMISWNDAQNFVNKLNERVAGLKVLLPTDAQWEYACRAGTTTKYSCGDDENVLPDYACYQVYKGRVHRHLTQPVGSKKPNAWGLYDMHGNVTEFCSDWSDGLPSTPQVDPQGPATGYSRVFRGGSCRDFSIDLTSANRKSILPGDALNSGGLRLALVTTAIAEYYANLPKDTGASSTPTAASSLPAALPDTVPAAVAPPSSSTPGMAPAATTAKAGTALPTAPTTAMVAPDAWMSGIPPRALAAYQQACADVKAGKGMLPMRSWRAFWGNKLRDPTRGYVELEFAELLLTDPSKEASPAAEEQKKQQNLKEAAIIIRSIRARNVSDVGLQNKLEETAKKLP